MIIGSLLFIHPFVLAFTCRSSSASVLLSPPFNFVTSALHLDPFLVLKSLHATIIVSEGPITLLHFAIYLVFLFGCSKESLLGGFSKEPDMVAIQDSMHIVARKRQNWYCY